MQSILLPLFIALCIVTAPLAAETYFDRAEPNRYRVSIAYEFEIQGQIERASAWLPLPEETAFQRLRATEFSLPGARTAGEVQETFNARTRFDAGPIPYRYTLWNLGAAPGMMRAAMQFEIDTRDRRLRRETLRTGGGGPEPVAVDLPPALEALAAQIEAEHTHSVDRLTAISSAITARLKYSIDAETLSEPRDDLAKTWNLRRGHCEQYTYLFIALANRLGIAARSVHGFMMQAQPDYPLGTHTWAEVFLPGPGWVEVEPQSKNDPMGDIFFIPGYVRTGALKWPGHAAFGNVVTRYGQRIESMELVAGDKSEPHEPPTATVASISSKIVRIGEQVKIKVSAAAADDGFIRATQAGVFSQSGGWQVVGLTHENPGEIVWTPRAPGEYWVTPYSVDNRGTWSKDTAPDTKPRIVVQ